MIKPIAQRIGRTGTRHSRSSDMHYEYMKPGTKFRAKLEGLASVPAII